MQNTRFFYVLVSDLDDGWPACLWKDNLGHKACRDQP